MLPEFLGYEAALADLKAQLDATGIPFAGIFFRPPNDGESAHFSANGRLLFVEIRHSAGVPKGQQSQLEAVISRFRFEKRRPKTRQNLRSALAALSDSDFKDLLVEYLVLVLETDPAFAKRIGKMLDGDEPTEASIRRK